MCCKKKSKFIVLSAPSGSGKTTLAKYLINCKEMALEFSISATSRKPRKGELNGEAYFFLTPEAFKSKIKSEEFLEYEEVYDNQFYGTLTREVQRLFQKGKHIIFDVDVEGGLNIKKAYPRDTLAIFIKPPSIEELKRRLEVRNTESESQVTMRVLKAQKEIARAHEFDVVVENDILEETKKKVYQIIYKFINL